MIVKTLLMLAAVPAVSLATTIMPFPEGFEERSSPFSPGASIEYFHGQKQWARGSGFLAHFVNWREREPNLILVSADARSPVAVRRLGGDYVVYTAPGAGSVRIFGQQTNTAGWVLSYDGHGVVSAWKPAASTDMASAGGFSSSTVMINPPVASAASSLNHSQFESGVIVRAPYTGGSVLVINNGSYTHTGYPTVPEPTSLTVLGVAGLLLSRRTRATK